jgi:hypothetical protein
MSSGRRYRFAPFASLALALLASLALAATGEWRESGTGFGGSRPEQKASFSDNGISLQMRLAPDTGLSYAREGAWPSSSAAAIRMSSDNVNTTGNDYVSSKAYFPVSVTFAFGEDSLSLGFWKRAGLFFRRIWSDAPPSGMCLTYAWGNQAPTGSMYRLWEEETVFVLAGGDDAGKEISAVRRLSDDFLAAYGRVPKGQVTDVRVRAFRPSGETGAISARLSLSFPAN